MNNDKTTFVPISLLEFRLKEDPSVFIEWHEKMSRGLGACQCILLANSDNFRPPMNPIIAAIPAGQLLTPDQHVLRRASQQLIDVFNANCYKAIEFLRLSIDPEMHSLAAGLWSLTAVAQPLPDTTFRTIVNIYRTHYVGNLGQQQFIRGNISSLNKQLNAIGPVESDAEAYAVFLKVELILQKLAVLGAVAPTGEDLRAMFTAILVHKMFLCERESINALVNPPETLAQIKFFWSHFSSTARLYKREKSTVPTAKLFAVSDAMLQQQIADLRSLVEKQSSAGGGGAVSSPSQADVVAAFQRGRESAYSPSANRGRERSPDPQFSQFPPGGRWLWHPDAPVSADGDRGRGAPLHSSPTGRGFAGRGAALSAGRHGGSGGHYGGGGGRYGGRSSSGGQWEQRKVRRVHAIYCADGTLREVAGDNDEVDDDESFDVTTYQPPLAIQQGQPPLPYQPPPPRSADAGYFPGY